MSERGTGQQPPRIPHHFGDVLPERGPFEGVLHSANHYHTREPWDKVLHRCHVVDQHVDLHTKQEGYGQPKCPDRECTRVDGVSLS